MRRLTKMFLCYSREEGPTETDVVHSTRTVVGRSDEAVGQFLKRTLKGLLEALQFLFSYVLHDFLR